MTDDLIEEFLRGDVPLTDPDARERARSRLRATIAEQTEPPPRHRHSRLAVFAIASAVAAILLVFQLLLPPGPVGPGLSAAAEIRKLGRISSRQDAVDIGPSEFVYHRFEETRREETVSLTLGTAFSIDLRTEVEIWVARDGSGRRVTTYQEVVFPTSLDRETWEDAGSPSIPASGDVRRENFEVGGLPVYPVDRLPTDPEALLVALNDRDVIDWEPGDITLLTTIGTLLAQEELSGDLRRALFEVAASIPGVTVEHSVPDPHGRAAVAVTATEGATQTRLFFDPTDARFLGREITYPADEAHPGGATEWRAYLESSAVFSLGERPAS